MRDDHGVSARSRLLDRLPDQYPDVVTAQLLAGCERNAAAHGPGVAALRDRLEHAGSEGLTSLLARHVSGLDPAPGRGSGDYLLIHVEEAETLGDESADLFPARAGGVRDADGCARHDDRRYEPGRSASSLSKCAPQNDREPLVELGPGLRGQMVLLPGPRERVGEPADAEREREDV